jgi:hypothetical protein
MTRRERVHAAFRHREPDRTPFFEKLIKSPIADLVLGRPSVTHNFVHRMGVLATREWEELVEAEAVEIADTVERLDMDLVRLGTNLGRGFARPRPVGEFTWREGDSIVRFIPGSPWVERRAAKKASPRDAASTAASAEDEQRAVMRELARDTAEGGCATSPPSDDELYVLRRAQEIMRERGLDPAIFVSVYAMPVCTLPRYMFAWFYDQPELLHRYYQRCSANALAWIARYIELGADIVGLGGDLAADAGPLISPAHYREFVLPHVRAQAQPCHALGAWCTTASDGDLWSMLDILLIESGVDGFEEIDAAAGMDLRRLKAAYGERMTFVGNIDIRRLLTSASTAEVERATIECIEAGWGNGGHILMSSNCIHEGIRPANFEAMVRAYRRHFGIAGAPDPLAVSRLDLPGYVVPS